MNGQVTNVQRNRRQLPGFTLIELLVVIAIIAILAALLLPAISGAKLKTHHVVCLNNLKQLGLVARLYHQDFGKGEPPWVIDRGLSGVRLCPLAKEPWWPLFAEVWEEGGAMRTPTPGTAGNYWFIPMNNNPDDDWKASYAFNVWFSPAALKSDTNSFPSAESVRYPVSTPLFADGVSMRVRAETRPVRAGSPYELFFGDRSIGSQNVGGSIEAVTIARHGPKYPSSALSTWPATEPLPRAWGVNVSFADGHVERVRLPDIAELTWHRNWASETRFPGR